MSVIETIFLVTMLTSTLDALLDKWLIYRYLFQKAAESKSRFIYDLTSCRFCIMFHLSWVVTILVGVFIGFEYSHIIVPFASVGLIKLIEK